MSRFAGRLGLEDGVWMAKQRRKRAATGGDDSKRTLTSLYKWACDFLEKISYERAVSVSLRSYPINWWKIDQLADLTT